MKLKKLLVVAIEAIEPAAKTHCEILKTSPVKVPGVPGKSFIFYSNTKQKIRFLIGQRKNPSSQLIQMQNKIITNQKQFISIHQLTLFLKKQVKQNSKERYPENKNE